MKTNLLMLFASSTLFLFFNSSFAQNFQNQYKGVLSQLYFERQPDPKSEAMGRGMSANSETDFGSYYNPALSSLGKGVNFHLSHTYQHKKNSDYDYIGISYNNVKTGGFSISKYNWAYGRTEGDNARFHNSIHTLNYSRDIGKDCYAGVNLNLVHMGFVRQYMFFEESGYDQKSSDAFSIDIGFLKKLVLESSSQNENLKVLQFGAAVYNVTGSVIRNKNTDDYYETLPIILRLGMSYNLKLLDEEIKAKSTEFQSFTHFELESILNGSDNPIFKLGQEFIISDLLILRGGLSTGGVEKSHYINSNDPSVTFGAGFKIGVNNFLKSADRATFVLDCAGPSPTSIRDNFYLFSLKINYIPN